MDSGEVKDIAALARMTLTEEEAETLKAQFAGILNHIRKIDELDLSDVEPVSHPFDIKNVFREDHAVEPLGAKGLLEIAPSHERSMIRVPQIIEGKS